MSSGGSKSGGKRSKSSSATTKASVYDKAVSKANAEINVKQVGVAYKSLTPTYKENIVSNLKLSKVMQDAVSRGQTNLQDEWITSVYGDKEKVKVITSFDGKNVNYVVKRRNKVLLKSDNKNRVANKVAEFYNERLNKVKSSGQMSFF